MEKSTSLRLAASTKQTNGRSLKRKEIIKMEKKIANLRHIGVDVRIVGNMIGSFMKTPVVLRDGGSIASISQKGRITVSDMFLELPSHVQEFILLHEIGHKVDNQADWELTPSRSDFVLSGEVSPEEIRADDYALKEIGETRAIKALEDFIEIMESKDVSDESLREVKMRLMAIKGLDVNPIAEVNPEEGIQMENTNTTNNNVVAALVNNKEEVKMNNLPKEEMKDYLDGGNILISKDEECIYLLNKSDDFLAEMLGLDASYNIIKISRKEDEFGLEINSIKNRFKYAYHYICRSALEQTASFEVDILKKLGSIDVAIIMPGLLGELPEKKWTKTTIEQLGLNIEPYEEMEEVEKKYLSRYTELFDYLEQADKLPVWECVPDNHFYLNAGTHRNYSVLAVQEKGTKRPFLVKVPFGAVEERVYGIEYNRHSSFGEECDYFFVEEKVSHYYIKRGEAYQNSGYLLSCYLTNTLEGNDTSLFYLEEQVDKRRYELNKKEIVISSVVTINGDSTFEEGKTHYSHLVISFFKRLNSLSKELNERVHEFLRDSLTCELKKELEYLPHRPMGVSFMTLFHYPNYIWAIEKGLHYSDWSNLSLNWTKDIKAKPLMKKAEFLNLFLPKIGKKGSRRVASQMEVGLFGNRDQEDFFDRTAFVYRQLELNNLLGSSMVDFMPLFNQFEGGPDFLTFEKWMETQGILNRFYFLCNKVYSSGRETDRREVWMLTNSVAKLLQIYSINEEYSISHLAEEKKILDFHNMLSLAFNKVIRNISDSPYDYNEEAKSLEQKDSKFSIELPTSPASIVEMGDKLSICVGGDDYLDHHNNGAYHVLSLKENQNIIGCIEVSNKEVLQFKLKHNKVINEDKEQEELSSFVKDWINKKELIILTQDLSSIDEEQEYDLPF